MRDGEEETYIIIIIIITVFMCLLDGENFTGRRRGESVRRIGESPGPGRRRRVLRSIESISFQSLVFARRQQKAYGGGDNVGEIIL